MTDSLINRLGCMQMAGLAAILSWAVLVLPSPTVAQATQPTPLGLLPAAGSGSAEPTAVSPPSEIQPAAPTVLGTQTPSGAIPPTAVEAGIKVDTLAAPDPDSLGVLDASNGGFPANIWQGSERGLIARLIEALPGKTRSPVIYGLIHRLLLTAAAAPTGSVGEVSLTALRIEQLKRMGDLEGVTDLLRVARVPVKNETLARAELDVLLMRYDNAGACEAAREGLRQYPTAYWQKAMVFCHALAGENAKALLGMDLLMEQGEPDTLFAALVGALAGNGQAPIQNISTPTPLHLAMLRAARRPLRVGMALADDPGLLRAIAVSPNADLALRLEAAERAVAFQALPAKFLAELYGTLDFSAEEMANVKSIADVDWTPRGRARLYRAVLGETAATVRAELLRNIWSVAREHGGYLPIAHMTMPQMDKIDPSPDFGWFAADAGRAFLAANRSSEAYKWLEAARSADQSNSEAAAGFVALWPLAKLADVEGILQWSPDALVAWWAAQPKGDKAAAWRRAGLLYSLFEAFGESVPVSAWAPLYVGDGQPATMPPLAIWRGLRAAADGRRVGETMLHALVMLGEAGPAAVAPAVLLEVIRALRQVGLDQAARTIAIEAAIATGI